MFYIELAANQYNALAIACAKNDVRFYFCGVHIHASKPPDGSVACTATNGKALYQTTPTMVENGADIADLPDIIVPFTTPAKAKETVRISFEDDWHPGAECTIEFRLKATRKIVVSTIEGEFPDTARVIPDLRECDTPYGEIGFSPRYMWEVPNKLLGPDVTIELKQREDGGPYRVVMHKRPDDILVVMPVRF